MFRVLKALVNTDVDGDNTVYFVVVLLIIEPNNTVYIWFFL